MRKKIIPLIFIAGGLIAGSVAYLFVASRYGLATAQAIAYIWSGMGGIYGLAFWLSRRQTVNGLLLSSVIKLIFIPVWILAVALLLTPAILPTMVAAILAILIMQGLYIVLSL